MTASLEIAKRVLLENSRVLHGIFGTILLSGYFPPRPFLNEFLAEGVDPCDQDGRMDRWSPIVLSDEEYAEVKSWWLTIHDDTIEDSLGASCWNDWVQEVLDRR